MTQFDARNLSMIMDLYEMTMANGYHGIASGNANVTFDVFFRHNPDNGGFSIFASLSKTCTLRRTT